MSRVTKLLMWMEGKPEIPIQMILGCALIVIGTYLIGPWYVSGHATAIGVTLEMYWSRFLVSAFYIASGIIAVYGVAKERLEVRYWGTMLMFLSFFFMSLLRLLTFGFTPIFWLPLLILSLVAGVLHITESRKRDADG